MSTYGPSTYGDNVADLYDDWFSPPPDAAIDRLESLAGAGPVLELGIGTGRFALPLAARGVSVHGIDASEEMVARLRAKPGGGAIPVTIGDFADVGAEGPFNLVFVVFNTFFGLLTQDDQVRCFANVADRLAPGGAFLIDAFVPDLSRFDRGQRVQVSKVGVDQATIDASLHDVVTQRVDTQHIVLTADGPKLFPVNLRYAWPSELDLMARLAGLELESRHDDWNGTAFTAAPFTCVSVWRKPTAAD